MATRRGKGEGGSPFKDKKGYWRAFVTAGYSEQGKQIKKWVYGKTRHEVAQKLAQLLPSAGSGLVNPTSTTLGEWLEYWSKERAKLKKLAPGTVENHERYIKRIKKTLANVRLAKYSAIHHRAFLAQLSGEGLSSSVVQHYHHFIKAALETAKRSKLIPENVADEVDPPPLVRVRQPRALRRDEVKALLAALEGSKFEAPIKLAITIGVRPSELLDLRWEHLEPPYLTIPGTKTENAPREIQLDSNSLQLLEHHRKEQRQIARANKKRWVDHGYIFPSVYGTRWINRNFRRDLDLILEEKELDKIRPHTFRYTYISHAIPLVGLKEVSQRVGHADPNFTAKQYQILQAKDVERSAKSLEELYSLEDPESTP